MKLKSLAFSLAGLGACFAESTPASVRVPNLVIIFADDLGYGDLGSYGHPSIRTPCLDRMAAEGLRFTDFYAAANLCTPSRAALLTGRYAVRSGMAGGAGRHVLYPNDKGGLPAAEITIAEALKERGYRTACIGKWHLGDHPEVMPNAHGFDYFYGLPYSNDMDVASVAIRRAESDSQTPDHTKFNVPLMRNRDIIERPVDQRTLTKRYTEEAVKFITASRDQPFLIYFAHTFPHVPLFASDQFAGRSRRGLYGDTVEELDWSVGEVLDALRRAGVAENTLVVFTSDNGPWLNKLQNGGSAGHLRDGKAGTWDGGHRVPAIAWWPGRIAPGSVTSALASTMDLFATSLGLVGAPLPSDRKFDSHDLRPVLFGDRDAVPRETFFYYYGDSIYAVRKGPFKAHFITHDGYSRDEPKKHDRPLLFHLPSDPAEKHDVAAKHPDIVAELTTTLEQHRRSVTPAAPQF